MAPDRGLVCLFSRVHSRSDGQAERMGGPRAFRKVWKHGNNIRETPDEGVSDALSLKSSLVISSLNKKYVVAGRVDGDG